MDDMNLFRATLISSAALGVIGCATTNGSLVPLDMASGRPVVEASFGAGQKERFVFDTGAQGGVIFKDNADALKLTIIGEALLGSPLGGPPISTFVVELPEIAVGSVRATNDDFVTMPRSTLSLPGVIGVMGPGQWSKSVVEIDVSGSTLWIGDAPRKPISVWLPLTDRNMLDGTTTIAGTTIGFHLDTGNPRGALLPMKLAEKLVPSGELTDAGAIRTVDTSVPVKKGNVTAAAQISDVDIKLSSAEFADVAKGNFGSATLRDFVIVIDNPNRRWGLRQR
jgi:hypothetical protein